MALRFHKSLRIFSWLKINVSKTGLSATLGKAPLSVNISEDKETFSLSAPGTGISYRDKLHERTKQE